MNKTSKDTELGSSFNDIYNARKIMLRNFPGVEFGKKCTRKRILRHFCPICIRNFCE